MAHGVESRVPFLDTNFVEFAMQIDPNSKMSKRASDTKALLRRAFSGMLPDEILWRAKHDGYGGNWKQRLVAHCLTEHSLRGESFQPQLSEHKGLPSNDGLAADLP